MALQPKIVIPLSYISKEDIITTQVSLIEFRCYSTLMHTGITSSNSAVMITNP